MKHLLPVIVLLFVHISNADFFEFSSIDSLLAWAIPRSTTVQSGAVKLSQAKQAKIAALLSIPDISGSTAASFTDNIKLPFTLFPGEMFGGAPGTSKEVEMGTKSTTSWHNTLELNLINLQGYNNVSQANLNHTITVIDNKLAIKSLSENIAAIYFNIVNYNEQIMLANTNARNADTIYAIALSKFNEGLNRSQDVGKARINCLNMHETLLSYKNRLLQQYSILKTLCEIPDSDSIRIEQVLPDEMIPQAASALPNVLQKTRTNLMEQLAKASYKGVKSAQKPKLSMFYSVTRQQNNSEAVLYDPAASWHINNSWGLNIKGQIPFTANNLSQMSKAKSSYLLAKNESERTQIDVAQACTQLNLDYENAYSKCMTTKEVSVLSGDNYAKDIDLYIQGIISLENILTSYSTMIANQINHTSSKAAVLYQKARITINNKEN